MSEPTDRSPATELLTDLEQSPELAAGLQSRVVPPEVLALPQTVAEIAAIVKATAERQDHTDAQIAELRATVNDFIAEQRQVNADSKRRHDHLYGEVSDLKGLSVERFIASQLRDCIFDHDPYLAEVTILRCQTTSEPDAITAIENAAREGRITMEERRQLLRADIIARAIHSQTRQPAHFVIEISNNIHTKDLTRAAARAQIYSKVIGLPVQPLTIGSRVHPDHQSFATGYPVPTLFHPRLEQDAEDEADSAD